MPESRKHRFPFSNDSVPFISIKISGHNVGSSARTELINENNLRLRTEQQFVGVAVVSWNSCRDGGS